MDDAIKEVAINQLRLAGAGMVLERVLYALMTCHPDQKALQQCLLAELAEAKAPNTLPGPLLESWHSTAARFLDHSVTLTSIAESQTAQKN